MQRSRKITLYRLYPLYLVCTVSVYVLTFYSIRQVIVIAPYGARQVVIAYSCVCVGHEGRPRAADPRATRVTYTHAATRNNHLSSIWGDNWLVSRARFEMIRKSEFFALHFLSFFLLFLPQCWNDNCWNFCLVEQIRASECMQHVITITSTEYDFHAAGEKDHLQKSVKWSFQKRRVRYEPCSFLTPR